MNRRVLLTTIPYQINRQTDAHPAKDHGEISIDTFGLHKLSVEKQSRNKTLKRLNFLVVTGLLQSNNVDAINRGVTAVYQRPAGSSLWSGVSCLAAATSSKKVI
jgi:hypothetical protein